ncbi:MAG: hypothetical protein ACQEQV_04035 [Fibrobacterota bacterium]
MNKNTNSPLRITYPFVLLVFAILCLATALFFTGGDGTATRHTFGTQRLSQNIATEDGRQVNKITFRDTLRIKRKNRVFRVKMKYSTSAMSNGEWAFGGGSVLDSSGTHLFGFGESFWHETGYDSDGRWSESNNTYTSKFTIQEPGTYIIESKVYKPVSHSAGTADIRIQEIRGSSVYLTVAGIIAIIAAVILTMMEKTRIAKPLHLGILIISLLILYLLLLNAARNGRGYPRYSRRANRYHSSSFFYWGGPAHYYGGTSRNSARAQGASFRGGGPGSGK